MAQITIRNILGFIQGYFRMGRELAGIKLSSHIYEQIIWRRTQVMTLSPECWKEGHCKVCGCEILGKTMENRGCGISESEEWLSEGYQPCYPEMMSKEEWENYKTNNNILLFK